TITSGDVGRFLVEDGSEVGVFAIEVDQVCAELTLLQHVAGACEVVDPHTGFIGPGFVAIEPLSEGAEGHARSLADERLVSRLVNDETINAVEELLIGGWLQG